MRTREVAIVCAPILLLAWLIVGVPRDPVDVGDNAGQAVHEVDSVGRQASILEPNAAAHPTSRMPISDTAGPELVVAVVDDVGVAVPGAVAVAGGSLRHIAKLTVYLTDLADYAEVNSAMEKYFESPFPARSVVQVAALPLGAPVEIDAIMLLDLSEYSF